MATKRYKRDFKELEARRRKGMRMLARGITQAEVARGLGVSRETVSTWEAMRVKDPQAWRRRPLGRPGSLSTAQRAELAKRLVAGALANDFPTELWTLARVAKLIAREFGRSYSSVHVWRLLKEMGFSSQRPTGRAIQRDEQAIVAWRTKRWSLLKKKPAAKAAPSSLSTKLA
jgi:transposase